VDAAPEEEEFAEWDVVGTAMKEEEAIVVVL